MIKYLFECRKCKKQFILKMRINDRDNAKVICACGSSDVSQMFTKAPMICGLDQDSKSSDSPDGCTGCSGNKGCCG